MLVYSYFDIYSAVSTLKVNIFKKKKKKYELLENERMYECVAGK